MESLLTTEDVAEWLRVDVVTVRRLVGRGDITAYRVGGEYRFKRDDLEGFLERQRIPAAEGGSKGLRRLLISPRNLGASHAIERFTEPARAVLVTAQEEAELMGHNHIGTEHILLGLMQGEGTAAGLLTELGISLEVARSAIGRQLTDLVPNKTGHPGGEKCLTARAKKVLELAAAEAQRLESERVGTEHLLLGIIREGKGVGAKTLVELRQEPEVVRKAIERRLRDNR